jgi:hypothetical protein
MTILHERLDENGADAVKAAVGGLTELTPAFSVPSGDELVDAGARVRGEVHLAASPGRWNRRGGPPLRVVASFRRPVSVVLLRESYSRRKGRGVAPLRGVPNPSATRESFWLNGLQT